ncbi:cache domain-containing sensor histidine kinase [Virgibacillus sp. CM-4]|uniref:cache domain-containing sensor histidine kinase n=1 Tax=Virgibacillus sp. CM-4 TaxID=1354277 RepID=UPI000415AF7F|nr:sensor histidine kinase [Virgibacillus sp. CM-4]
MMIPNWGLKRKFITVFVVLITLPTVFGFIIYYQTSVALKDQAKEDIIGNLEKNEQNLSAIIEEVTNMTAYMTYDKEFRTFFMTPEAETHQLAYKNAVDGINGYFTFQMISKPYVSSVLLEAEDGTILDLGEPILNGEKELAKAAIQKSGAPLWSDAYHVTSEWEGEKEVISVSRAINDLNQINNRIGMVRIRLDHEKLYRSIESQDSSTKWSYFVLSNEGSVVLHSDPSLVGKQYPETELATWVTKGKASSYRLETKDSNYLVVKKELQGTNWYSVAMVDEGEVVQELYHVRNSIRNMIILLVLLGAVAFVGFYRSNIRRIIELTRQTWQVSNGDFTASVDVQSRDEIGILGMHFNKMVKTIQNHINVEYRLKIKQKDSELKALQSQIDPHFLYNTLDMIRWTARLENAYETSRLIERLSSIFRMKLNNGKPWVQLKEEINYIKNYLELQQSRLGDRLQFYINVQDDVKGNYVLKQLLQPLVENSIKHGFKDLPRQGIIRIHGYRSYNSLYINVIDNGWGFTNPEKIGIHGYALRNLQERLELVFGKAATLEKTNLTQGASIQIVLPLIDMERVKNIQRELGE